MKAPGDRASPAPAAFRSPRALAAWALDRFERAGEAATEFLARISPGLDLKPEDGRLLRDLALGTLRHRITLDAILAAYLDAGGPGRLRPPIVRPLLEVGLYQLLYTDRIPPHAAVHETVEAAKERAGRKVAGLVNAVLRRFLAERGEVREGEAPPPRRILPRDGRPPVLLGRDVLPPDPPGSAPWLAIVHGIPAWLVRRWLARLGPDRTGEILRASNRTPETVLRVNPLKTTREALLEALERHGIEASPGEAPAAIRIGSAVPFSLLPPFARGHFQVQDETAQSVAPLLEPKEGEWLLEVGAGPGGKATHLAELSGDRARVVALDLRPDRLKRLAENAGRLGLSSILPLAADGLALPFKIGFVFDKAILDAPCSNTGVLARRPEARHRISDASIARAAERQRGLLGALAKSARPGGLLAYSTCSIEPEENEETVRIFLSAHPNYVLRHERLTLPSPTRDGGYAAVMERRG